MALLNKWLDERRRIEREALSEAYTTVLAAVVGREQAECWRDARGDTELYGAAGEIFSMGIQLYRVFGWGSRSFIECWRDGEFVARLEFTL